MRSISSVAAASAPSRRQQQATAVSCDDERSTGALLVKFSKINDEDDVTMSPHFPRTYQQRTNSVGHLPVTPQARLKKKISQGE